MSDKWTDPLTGKILNYKIAGCKASPTYNDQQVYDHMAPLRRRNRPSPPPIVPSIPGRGRYIPIPESRSFYDETDFNTITINTGLTSHERIELMMDQIRMDHGEG